MKEEIKKFFRGDLADDAATLDAYSHDASLFEVRPKLVAYPKDGADLAALVKWVGENKEKDPTLSVTVRSAGSCMSGGSLNESIIADVMKYMNKMGEVAVESELRQGSVVTQPGVYYRDFEPKTLEKGLILPCFTASKNLNALGGMFGNNSAGERTLRYGKTEKYVLRSKVIFSDGNEYEVKPLSRAELDAKMAQGDFEGNIYKKLFTLLDSNKELVERSRPHVSKNSAGYYLWNVQHRVLDKSVGSSVPDTSSEEDREVFDLNKLLVGSQGTLALATEMTVGLVPVMPVSKLFVVFLPDLSRLAEIVNEILPTKPLTLESYDDATLKLAVKFFPDLVRLMKANVLKLLFSFLPEAGMILTGGFPKLILLVEYDGETEAEVNQKMKDLRAKIAHFGYKMRETRSEAESEKYWTIRRESFNLLRKHVKGRRTAPFVDDVIVLPEHMPEFLPKMQAILHKYDLDTTIAGHAGDGNFHIIPLMDMHKASNVEVIKKCAEEVYDLVGAYHGSITAEHNDGIVRTPYLGRMYPPETLELFKQTKEIFDPKHIFNPGKKVGIDEAYMTAHIKIEKTA